MHSLLLRCGITIAFACSISAFSSAEPPPRLLTSEQTDALREPLDLGYKLHGALFRYFSRPGKDVPGRGVDLVTGWPTIDVLHVLGYITDSDMRLVKQYKVSIATVAFQPTDPVLTMQTKVGQISFDARGTVSLHDPQTKQE